VSQGHGFYDLAEPVEGPASPGSWSYSTLSEWRACPRRWWLTRAQYSGFRGRYPRRVYAATVEGQMVHDALEKFIEHIEAQIAQGITDYMTLRRTFPVRRVMAERRKLIEAELVGNPRIDLQALRPKISIDKCVDAFRRVSATMQSSFDPSSFGERQEGTSGKPAPQPGAEVTIKTIDPPLGGRIDWLSGREIIDFKTGERDEKHADQLRFYALLLWLQTGRTPDALTLIYTDPVERVSVPVPSESELQLMRETLASEITSIEKEIGSSTISTRPSEEVCRWCPAKAHCDDYWSSPSTRHLRLGELAGDPNRAEGDFFIADLEVNGLPSPDGGDLIMGEAYCPSLGTVQVELGRSWRSIGSAPEQARVLGAYVRRTDQAWMVSLGLSSEVFWKCGH
jgi:hypothetical protein